MNLNVGGLGELPPVGPSDSLQEQISIQWNTYNEIEYQLSMRGIHPLPAPQFAMPEITPQLLQGLDDNQYMAVWQAFDAWNNYIAETVSQLENIILQTKNEMDDLRVHIIENAKATAKAGGTKVAADDMKLFVENHPRQRYLKNELQKNEQMLNRLVARQKTMSRSERLLSRNIELIKSAREASGSAGGGGQRRASGGYGTPRY